MKILPNAVKDHLVPVISKLETAHAMFIFLENMYEINNTNIALELKQQLHHIKMNKGGSITSYFIRITELKDKLSTVGHIIDKKELTMLALNGIPTSWETFIQGISARSKLPRFHRLKTGYIQEESRLITKGIRINNCTGEIQVLNTNSNKKEKKGNFKKKRGKDNNKHSFKRKDMSKVQYYKIR